MNRQEKIHRLETLLERVQLRAKQPRLKEQPAAAPPITESEPAHVMGLATPTPPQFMEKDETQPFERDSHGDIHARPMTPLPDEAPTVPKKLEPEMELEIDIEVEEEQDDVGAGGLEIVEEAPTLPKQERPASETKQAEFHAPEATTKPLIDLDLEPGPVAPEGSSDALIGATVELEAPPENQPAVEIAPTPKTSPRPSAEMEAVLPPSVAPGAYTPDLSPSKPPAAKSEPVSESKAEPSTKPLTHHGADIDSGQSTESSPTPSTKPQPAVASEPEPSTKPQPPSDQATVLKITPAEAPEPVASPPPTTTPAGPVTLEVSGQIVTPKELSAEQVTRFVGSLEQKSDDTFLAWLDESLSL